VASQPPRRPRAAKRFARAVSNDLWQIDATPVPLADQTPVWVIDLLDDYARYLLGATAFPDATARNRRLTQLRGPACPADPSPPRVQASEPQAATAFA